ncbi:3-ketoacyl-ACP reductase [Bradyrhizobium centrolobii]|uniref:3-ketoacyl-ACP reductase n=1 Tax=Bradyrhizobium centrolobii TaxID=1505087 RepID=A0A176YRE2_9BRAD|nr:3-ketoacyl-ACP reductase [Bradyrhizobium centrolobii]OAF10239.1 3-ketoacyl-ACP reductase [Bradyrhizobium centrolobii]
MLRSLRVQGAVLVVRLRTRLARRILWSPRVSLETQEQEAIPTTDRYYRCDVSDIGQHDALLATIAGELGEPSCLVNNAGVTSLQRGDILDLKPESYDRTLNINLRAGFFLTQSFAKRRLSITERRPGSIIFIGSANAEIVGENRGDYCISKAGVAMMAKLFASRLATESIAVYEIRPGVIRTGMTAAAKHRYDDLIAAGGIPMARWGEPEEIGRTVTILARGELPYATGIHIDVGGGLQLYRV